MRNTICLVIMAKNEAHNIVRCIESCRPYIHRVEIMDSGSTDGTQQLATDYLTNQGIPFEIYNNNDWTDHGWKGGGEKRTQLLAHAMHKCDYTLIMDADQTLSIRGEDPFHDLDADAYRLHKVQGQLEWDIEALFKSDLDWTYVGILHEYAQCDYPGKIIKTIHTALITEPVKDGRDAKHYYDHALKLEAELLKCSVSDNLKRRYVFYIAQSWRDALNSERALAAYRERVRIGGWCEEVWYSLFQIAAITESLTDWLAAWSYRPQRIETGYWFMRRLHEAGNNLAAIQIGDITAQLQPCSETLFMDKQIHEWFENLHKLIIQQWHENH